MGVFFRSLGIFKGFLKFFRSLAVFKASPVLLHMIYNIYYMFKAPYIVLTPCKDSNCAAWQEDHIGAAAGQGRLVPTAAATAAATVAASSAARLAAEAGAPGAAAAGATA